MKTKKDDLIGKTVMNKEGLIIGKIRDIYENKKIKEIKTTLIKPSKQINLNTYKLNKQGEIIIPFKSLTKVKNIFIFEELNQMINKAKKLH
jgi:sporulation protein YlmC with PRC-barrel domain